MRSLLKTYSYVPSQNSGEITSWCKLSPSLCLPQDPLEEWRVSSLVSSTNVVFLPSLQIPDLSNGISTANAKREVGTNRDSELIKIDNSSHISEKWFSHIIFLSNFFKMVIEYSVIFPVSIYNLFDSFNKSIWFSLYPRERINNCHQLSTEHPATVIPSPRLSPDGVLPNAQQFLSCWWFSGKGKGLPISSCCHYTFFETHVFACTLKEN